MPLLPRTVASFFHACMEALRSLDIDVRIRPVPNEVVTAIPFAEDTEHASYDGRASPAGERRGILVVALVAIGGVVAYLVVIAALVLPSVRRREGTPISLRALFPHFELDAATTAVAARVVIAVALCGIVSGPLGAHRSYWVIIAAVAVLQAGNSRRMTVRGRIVDTLLGATIALAVFRAYQLVHDRRRR